MLQLIIFAGAIALVFAIATGIGTLVITFDPSTAAVSSVMIFIVTFFAATLLCLNDYWKQWRFRHAARQRLLARADTPDAEYLASFPEATRKIAIHSRKYIAGFFHVPEQRLRPDDQLDRDYGFDQLGGVAWISLSVLGALEIELQPGDPILENIESHDEVRDLVAAIDRTVAASKVRHLSA
jgi:hypothetical protein